MLASVKTILQVCSKSKTAVGAFNISDLPTLQAVIRAGINVKRPVIVQITEKTLEYAGDVEITNLARNMIEHRSNHTPMAVHLDHGRSFQACKRAVDLGFNSIMIDGSALSFQENKALTKKVVDLAHKQNVTVQGELGTVPYLGRHQVGTSDEDWNEYMTNPDQAQEFVKFTGVDSLAVGIGNAHGFQKERDVPDWKRLSAIFQATKTPLILHGASDWTSNKIKRAVERGITCFNVDTDIRVAYVNKLCTTYENGCMMEDPRKIMAEVRDFIQRKVEEKIRMFHC